MSFDRMNQAAIQLVDDLGIDGTDHDHLTDPVIHPRDAIRFVIKTIREIRHQIGLGGTPDLSAAVAKTAEHLDADPEPIAKVFSAEATTFADECEDRLTLYGAHAVFTVDDGYLDRRELPGGVVPRDRVL